jgi:hypothetical protein
MLHTKKKSAISLYEHGFLNAAFVKRSESKCSNQTYTAKLSLKDTGFPCLNIMFFSK